MAAQDLVTAVINLNQDVIPMIDLQERLGLKQGEHAARTGGIDAEMPGRLVKTSGGVVNT